MAVLDTRLLVEVQFDCNIAPRILPYSRKLEFFFSFQILMSVSQTTITVMSMLSVITLRDLITAHAALDTLELEQHVPVKREAIHSISQCKGIQDSLGFWIPQCGFRIPLYWFPDSLIQIACVTGRIPQCSLTWIDCKIAGNI